MIDLSAVYGWLDRNALRVTAAAVAVAVLSAAVALYRLAS